MSIIISKTQFSGSQYDKLKIVSCPDSYRDNSAKKRNLINSISTSLNII